MINVIAMDHIVLNVHDMDKMLDFYINVLGLEGERIDAFGEGKVPFPSVRISADTLIDLFPMPEQRDAQGPVEKRLNHFCMVIEPAEMPEVIAHLETHGELFHFRRVMAHDPSGGSVGSHDILKLGIGPMIAEGRVGSVLFDGFPGAECLLAASRAI